jgi:hypothetical protein
MMRNTTIRDTIIALAVIGAIFFGIEQIPGPAKYVPPALPPHVLVLPHNQFLVAPGYGAFGRIICNGGKGQYQIEPGGKPFGGWYILSCKEGAHNFSYPRAKEWSYASS